MRKKNTILNVLLISILILYPLIGVRQGLSVIDTTYSPANFTFFEEMSGTWIVATYLANVLGHLFTVLPGGDTLPGLNIYSSLLTGVISAISYKALSERMGAAPAFLGEILAIGLCWCPSTILYNYLTYFLFNAGVLLMLDALDPEMKAGTSVWRLWVAGLVLGLNVTVRLPNLAECALIIVVWYSGLIRKTPLSKVLRQTGICVLGYLTGFLAGFIPLCIRFGAGAYMDMIRSLFMMTDKATDYKPLAMIGAMFSDYIYAFRWICMWIAAAVICASVILIIDRRTADAGDGGQNRIRIFSYICTALVFCLVIRICYGQGMFSFRYYEYGSMFFWAVIALFFISAACICNCLGLYDREDADLRELSASVLLIIYITCIGSNNGLYPAVNNMFIVAPFGVYLVVRTLKRVVGGKDAQAHDTGTIGRYVSVSLGLALAVLMVCTLIQSVGFHFTFAFGDGIYGEQRSAVITGFPRVAGIHTTEKNAADLTGLMEYMRDLTESVGDEQVGATLSDSPELITYGDIPGLGYILDMPPALSTFWPDLDSYNYIEWERDLDMLEQSPVIVVTLPVAAWIDGNSEAVEYFGADSGEYTEDRKLADLIEYIHKNGYTQTYSNDGYAVYLNRTAH